MNFSSVKSIHLDKSLCLLGHREPSNDNLITTSSPRDTLPTFTNWHVLERLRTLPSLEDLQNLQAKQMKVKSQIGEYTLQWFCSYAGDYQIRALGILTQLAYDLTALDHERLGQPFVDYKRLIQAAVAIREAHVTWEMSIDREAFFRKSSNSRPRIVRYQYLSYLLRTVLVISALTFPEDYQDEYVLRFEAFLRLEDWEKHLTLDSEETYELSRERARRARPDTIAPPERYPARYMLQYQTFLRPCLVYKDGVLVRNARCKRKGA